MACDGDIADEEVELISKKTTDNPELFAGLEVESMLNGYVSEINAKGISFLSEYIREVANASLSDDEQLQILALAVEMIEADNKIEYSEIAFFKKIRFKLSVLDDRIIELLKKETIFDKFPELRPEDFILPDIVVEDDLDWNASFGNIELKFG